MWRSCAGAVAVVSLGLAGLGAPQVPDIEPQSRPGYRIARRSADAEAIRNLFDNGQLRLLEKLNRADAELLSSLRGIYFRCRATKTDLAAVGSHDACQYIYQGRLACAVLADNRMYLSGINSKRYVGQRLCRSVGLGKITYVEK